MLFIFLTGKESYAAARNRNPGIEENLNYMAIQRVVYFVGVAMLIKSLKFIYVYV